MRQTIECEECAKVYIGRHNMTQVHGESISKTLGFPLNDGYRCDGCNKELPPAHLVVAVGVWNEDKGIYNYARWPFQYIREASRAEVLTYRQAEDSAKEMRKDGTV